MSREKVPYYYVSLSALDARVAMTVNGVGFHEGDGRGSLSFNSPMNVNLVGDSNRVRVTVTPTMLKAGGPMSESDSLRSSTLEEARVTVMIKRLTGKVFAPETGEVLAAVSLEDAIEEKRDSLRAAFAERLQQAAPTERKALLDKEENLTTVTLPVTITAEFASEDVPSFAELFREGPVVEDEEAVKDFAMQLQKMTEERDSDGLYEAFESKFDDYDVAYPEQAEEDNREWFREDVLEKYIYPNGPLLDFEREDLKLRKWADSRVWEVNVDRGGALGDQFFLTGLSKEERRFNMDIFVARVDGELKVVR